MFIDGIEGGNYSVLCSAKGGLENMYQWTYLRTNSNVTSNTTLNVDDVNVLDGGTYQCMVTNSAGSDAENFTLNSMSTNLTDMKYSFIDFSFFQLLHKYLNIHNQ